MRLDSLIGTLVCLDEIHKIKRVHNLNRTQFFIGKGIHSWHDGRVNTATAYRNPVNQSRYEDLWAYMRFMFSDDYMAITVTSEVDT